MAKSETDFLARCLEATKEKKMARKQCLCCKLPSPIRVGLEKARAQGVSLAVISEQLRAMGHEVSSGAVRNHAVNCVGRDVAA